MLWLSGTDGGLIRVDHITGIHVQQPEQTASSWCLTCTQRNGSAFRVYSGAGELDSTAVTDVVLALARELHLEQSAGRAGVLFVLHPASNDPDVDHLPIRFGFESWNRSPFPA